MAEYVDREAIKSAIRKRVNNSLIISWLISIVNTIPAAEVAPVVHGRWILPTKLGHRYFDIPHCSACDGVPCGVDENTKYCPNCGARMDDDGNG